MQTHSYDFRTEKNEKETHQKDKHSNKRHAWMFDFKETSAKW